jgi:hypothetical protein
VALTLRPDDDRLTWQGAISLERSDEWVMPWRLPYEHLALFPPEALAERAAMPAGVRVAFYSDTDTVAGSIEPDPELAPLDLCCDGKLFRSTQVAGHDAFCFAQLPAGRKLIELWLPQFGRFRLRELRLSDGATVEPFANKRPRWVTYGSSITHCRVAESPTQTWPAVVARTRELNLTCLGFGGQCHLDMMVARMIRDLPADYLSMCVGINIQGGSSLNTRSFQPAIFGFVQVIRERHPDIPFVVMSPILSPPRETVANAVGFDLRAMRQEVAEAVQTLRSHGDQHIHYIDGLDIFGPKDAHLLPDELHPNAEGYKLMGSRFAEKVAARLFV